MLTRFALLGLAASVVAKVHWAPTVKNDGEPVGQIKNINGTQIYHSFPPSGGSNSTTAILYLTDIFGIPNPQAKLLADSLAAADYTVIMPDLFKNDSVPLDAIESGLNLTEWLTRHGATEVDPIIEDSITYIRNTLGFSNIAGVGYCFGGRYVPRHMTNASRGIDVGFIAHPSNLLPSEIEAVANPLSIAAGELDASYNATHRSVAEAILQRNNLTFEASLYSGAPHGFGVKVDWSVGEQRYAKTAAFYQALQWFGFWLA
ncbi:alpha/beta-hydrolase [Periconia macrospinosa]|uniref:Alpha/beta-hydrolase n=1 Tax=Periconia macrospinosa TaxID=97972 RepID=A0A2V1D7F3_9PLEO|nr:alpha/beta-hydrolase [Periconia macrospinosa]